MWYTTAYENLNSYLYRSGGWGAPRKRDFVTGGTIPHVDRLNLFPNSGVHGAISRPGQVLKNGDGEEVTITEQNADDPHQKTTVTWNR